MENALILLPILWPVFIGGCMWIPAVRRRRFLRGAVQIAAMTGELVLSIWAFFWPEGLALRWNLTADVSVYFRLDGAGKVILLLCAAAWLVSVVYSREYMEEEDREYRYDGFIMMAMGAVAGVCCAGNLIALYLCYEWVTLMCLPLVLQERTKEAVSAGLKFLFYSIFGALCALFGIFALARVCGTLDFTAGGVLDPELVSGQKAFFQAVIFIMLLGFGSKAGMWPLHGWLPTAHPAAPAPASALLSGNITKMGFLCSLRVVYQIAGTDFLKGTWVQYAWMSLALLTVFMGSMLACREKILKKRLAYSTVSQVSYALFGLALMTPAGVQGALTQAVFHCAAKNLLFLGAGAVILKTGLHSVDDLDGIGRRLPVVMACFTLASLTLVGLPPTGGALSKMQLALGSLSEAVPVLSWLGPVILIGSALLTAAYLIPVVLRAYFSGDTGIQKAGKVRQHHMLRSEATLWIRVPMVALTAVMLLAGMFPGFLDPLLSGALRALGMS